MCTISKFAFTYFEFIWYFDLVIICEENHIKVCGLKAFTTIIVLEIRFVTYLTVVFSANIMYK